MRRESHVRFCESAGVKLPRATHLVILCRKGNADQALQQLRKIMSKLKLTVNEEKTRICRVPEGTFDFLGYTFGRMYSARTGQARLGYRPSKKSIKRMVEKIHALTDRTGTWQETTKLVGKVNRTLRRRSQKDRFSWQRMHGLAADWLPQPRILHPYPDRRFAVMHPR